MSTKHKIEVLAGRPGMRRLASSRQAKRSLATELTLQDQQLKVVKAACHDLRQPLQSLVMLQVMLARAVEDAESATLVARLDDSLNLMTAILQGLAETSPRKSDPTVQTQSDGDVRKGASAQKHIAPTEVRPAPADTVLVVADDAGVRLAITDVLEIDGHRSSKCNGQ